jgi:hypothetical protein
MRVAIVLSWTALLVTAAASIAGLLVAVNGSRRGCWSCWECWDLIGCRSNVLDQTFNQIP